MQAMWSLSRLLMGLLVLGALLGAQGRHQKHRGDEEQRGSTTEGDVVITTTRNESHASASAFASAGGASATANAETTFNTLTSVNGESDEESEEKSSKGGKKSKKNQGSEEDEKHVSERVRDAVLNGNVDRVASLLGKLNETDLLGLGFTFPARRREFNLIFTTNRTTDPDVVALKGMAKAALEGVSSEKLTEIFIAAVYGLDFDDSVCFKPPKYTHSTHSRVETKNKTVVKSGYRKITNESGTFTIDKDPQVRNSVSTDSLFEETDVEFVVPEKPSVDEEELEEVCYTQKEIKTIRKNLRRDFSDVELMTSIVEGIPGEVSQRQRSLLNAETPRDTWLCSACWKKKFCNQNVYWCP